MIGRRALDATDPGPDNQATGISHCAGTRPQSFRHRAAAASATYRVRRMKFFPLSLDDDSQGQDATAGDNSRYLVDHSAAFFLVGPDGGGLVHYAHGMTAEEIAEDIRQVIAAKPR